MTLGSDNATIPAGALITAKRENILEGNFKLHRSNAEERKPKRVHSRAVTTERLGNGRAMDNFAGRESRNDSLNQASDRKMLMMRLLLLSTWQIFSWPIVAVVFRIPVIFSAVTFINAARPFGALLRTF